MLNPVQERFKVMASVVGAITAGLWDSVFSKAVQSGKGQDYAPLCEKVRDTLDRWSMSSATGATPTPASESKPDTTEADSEAHVDGGADGPSNPKP